MDGKRGLVDKGQMFADDMGVNLFSEPYSLNVFDDLCADCGACAYSEGRNPICSRTAPCYVEVPGNRLPVGARRRLERMALAEVQPHFWDALE